MGLLYKPSSTIQDITSFGGSVGYINNTVQRCQGIYWTSSGIKEVFDYLIWITLYSNNTIVNIYHTITMNTQVRRSGGTYLWYENGIQLGEYGDSSMSISKIEAGTYTYYTSYTYEGVTVNSNELVCQWLDTTVTILAITVSSTNPLVGVYTYFSISVNQGTSGSYQWYQDGVAITSGGTGTTYSVTSDTPVQHTYYLMRGSTTSNSITVTWGEIIVTVTADDYDAVLGQTVTLRCIVTGGSPTSYTWLATGGSIPAGNTSTLQLTYNTPTTLNISCRVMVGVRYTSNVVTVIWS